MPAPNVLVMQLVDHGNPYSTRICPVSEDDSPILQTNLFNRAFQPTGGIEPTQ